MPEFESVHTCDNCKKEMDEFHHWFLEEHGLSTQNFLLPSLHSRVAQRALRRAAP